MNLIAVCILALLLRLVSLNQSFWLDEAIGVIAAKNQSWIDLLTRWPMGDNHPPLYYLVLKGWGDMLGYSEVAVRFLSIIFGVLTVFFVFKIAKEFIRDKKISNFFPIMTAFLMATSPLHIYYSQEARMYVFSGALATMAVYFFVRSLRLKNIWNFLGFSVSIALLSFSDYLPVVLLAVFWVYAITSVRDKGWWKGFILSHFPLLTLWAWWLPIFIVQSQAGKVFLATLPAWSNLAGGANLKQIGLVWTKFVLGRISFFQKGLYYSLLGVSYIPFLATLVFSLKTYKKTLLFWLWLTVPLILGFTVSFFVPAFTYFRFIFILPAFYLLLGWGITTLKGKLGNILGILLVTINLVGWGLYAFNPGQHRENWRGAVRFIEEKATGNDLILFANPEPFAPYQWYSEDKVKAIGILDSVKIDRQKVVTNLTRQTFNADGIYYFSYLSDLMDPEGIVVDTLSELNFTPVAEYADFGNVGKITYFQASE